MEKNLMLKTDILDIIFEKRNKAYGAYELRKFYPDRLKLALMLIFITAVVFSVSTWYAGKKINTTTLVYMPPDIIVKELEITPKDPEKKTERPKPETKPAVKSTANTRAFISNVVIVPKGTKTDSITTLLPTDIISTTTVITSTPGIPTVEPVAVENNGGNTKSLPAMDKNVPLEGNAVDVLPTYPGGMEALREFLQKHLETPGELEAGQTVSVRVKFVVDFKGKLTGFVTMPGGGQAYNNEVVRVLKKMPDWIPGKTRGEKVSVYYVIPVKFESAD